MKRFALRTAVAIALLYGAIHLVLGSTPVQRRVVEEIRAALLAMGIELSIESIEFSAFSPRIYLNRVTLIPKARPELPLTDPLAIDKIKIEFRPIALIYRRVVISDLVLFHPRIVLPDSGKLYRRVSRFLQKKSKPSLESGKYTVVLERFGVVDAFLNIVSHDPPFAVRSRSVSAFMDNTTSGQQNFTVQSNNLDWDRGRTSLAAGRVDVDIDVSERSLRVNRAILEGQEVYLSAKGSASLPFSIEKKMGTAQGSFEVRGPLPFLRSIEELKTLPDVSGKVSLAGSLRVEAGVPHGSGSLRYEKVTFKGYGIGDGVLSYSLTEKEAVLSDLALKYSDGEVRGKKILIGLSGNYPISGEVSVKQVRLETLLANVKSPGIPILLPLSGLAKVKGQLRGPLQIGLDTQLNFPEFEVYDTAGALTKENLVIKTGPGSGMAALQFSVDGMHLQSSVDLLGGKLVGDGDIIFDSTDADFTFKGEGLSLTRLGSISRLEFGGKADLEATLQVRNKNAVVTGTVSSQGLELERIAIGQVKGRLQFVNYLLSFDDLSVDASGPISGRGYVDLRGPRIGYRFDVDVKRAEVNQVFQMFAKRPLDFQAPSGGDVSGRVTIRGGGEIESRLLVQANGGVRNTHWYGEKWLSGKYGFSFEPGDVRIDRVLLMKRSGGLEVKGTVKGKKSHLSFSSYGLRVEEMDYLTGVPLAGELVGSVLFDGPFALLSAVGSIKLVKSSFRGVALPDSQAILKRKAGISEVEVSAAGERLTGLIRQKDEGSEVVDLNVQFREFDFTPGVAVLLGKDVPTFADLFATGDVRLTGVLSKWDSMRGVGRVSKLAVGLRGTPLTNTEPIPIVFESGAVRVSRTQLQGRDGQVHFQMDLEPRKSVDASLDGKIDLEFLQPFIPGLEYGSGKVSASLRMSGNNPNYALLGNAVLEDGVFRLVGLGEEFRSAQVQMSFSQDRVSVDRFEATSGGGNVYVSGDVKIDRFQTLKPNLKIVANRAGLKFQNYLTLRVSGDFAITGSGMPYQLTGRCKLNEGALRKFEVVGPKGGESGKPLFEFDVRCQGNDNLMVITDMMDAEFRGSFQLVGNTQRLGLLGSAETLRGSLLFSGTKFNLVSGTVKFESPGEILPRFSIAAQSLVKEKKTQGAEQYEVNLQAYGVPKDYKIRLSSSPSLSEGDIISLLVLGDANRNAQDGGYLDLGSALAGQNPISSKLQNELGLDVRLGKTGTGQTSVDATNSADPTVPNLQVQKSVTENTKLSVSNTLESVPQREFRLEQVLDDNFSLSGSLAERNRGSVTESQSIRSYGLDFRYRFSFE